MKQAIMCFMANEIPLQLYANKEKKEQITKKYIKDLLWKILAEKDIIRDA